MRVASASLDTPFQTLWVRSPVPRTGGPIGGLGRGGFVWALPMGPVGCTGTHRSFVRGSCQRKRIPLASSLRSNASGMRFLCHPPLNIVGVRPRAADRRAYRGLRRGDFVFLPGPDYTVGVRSPVPRIGGPIGGRLCQKSLPFVHIMLFTFLFGITTLYMVVSFRFFDF